MPQGSHPNGRRQGPGAVDCPVWDASLVGKRLAVLVTAGVICAGLAVTSASSAAAPKASPSEALATADLPVTTTQQALPPHTLLATPAVALLRESATDLVTLGNMTYAQVSPRRFCHTLESMFGAVPNAFLRDLPIWGAVYLPGCVAGQIPALHSTLGRETANSEWLRVGGSLGANYEAHGATVPGESPPSG
jgi:hypothetical protein